MSSSMEQNWLARQAQPPEDSLAPVKNKDESRSQKDRRTLGIPAEFDTKPVLHLSSYQDIPGAAIQDKIAKWIDLSQSSSEQVVDLLEEIMLRTEPTTENRALPSRSGENIPATQYSVSAQFLPALDARGLASEPAQWFAIDRYNYRKLLPVFAKFLKQKGIVTRPHTAIEE